MPQPPDSKLPEMAHTHHFSSQWDDVFQVVGVILLLADGLAGSDNSNPATDQRLVVPREEGGWVVVDLRRTTQVIVAMSAAAERD